MDQDLFNQLFALFFLLTLTGIVSIVFSHQGFTNKTTNYQFKPFLTGKLSIKEQRNLSRISLIVGLVTFIVGLSGIAYLISGS